MRAIKPKFQSNQNSQPMNTSRRQFAGRIAGQIVLGAAATSFGLAASGSVHALFAASDENQQAQIDHRVWDQILRTYVRSSSDGLNRVNYGALKQRDAASLDAYLRGLAGVPISRYNRAQQFAYWVNLYNALTLKVIVDAYPVSSIKSVGGLLGFGGPWKAKRFTVEGQKLSLDDIEHNILRANWRDPRVHYAVNCASIGCPNLQATAFTAQNTQSLLNKGAVEYINSSRGAVVRNGRLQVSSIYVWFKADFGGSDQGVIQHMKSYAQPNLRQALDRINSVAGHDYNWDLNDTKQ